MMVNSARWAPVDRNAGGKAWGIAQVTSADRTG
jgi:hypothetical protein